MKHSGSRIFLQTLRHFFLHIRDAASVLAPTLISFLGVLAVQTSNMSSPCLDLLHLFVSFAVLLSI